MDTMRLVFSLLVVSFTVSSVHALEWVEYEGTIPENAVSVNEGTEDRPVCRKNSRIGIVNDAGKCYSVKVGGGVSKKTEDDGYQILVDNSETEIELAVAAATEGTYTQAEYDAVVAENATLQESNATLEADLASANASSVSTDDTWSYDSQREAILSVGEVKSWKNKLYSENMDHDMRNFHLKYLDEDSTPVTMYDIAIANTKVSTPAMSYPVGSCNGWGTSTWVEHLAAEGVHPQLAVLIARFGNRYYARGTGETNCNSD